MDLWPFDRAGGAGGAGDGAPGDSDDANGAPAAGDGGAGYEGVEDRDPLAMLQAELEVARGSEARLRDQLQRLAAEFDNFRKRSARDVDAISRARTEALASDLLDVLDNFERGLAAQSDGGDAFKTGMELVYRRLKEILERHGVREIDPAGEEFDPNLHEAIHAEKRQGVPPNRILHVAQKGYAIADRLLRPARVSVSR